MTARTRRGPAATTRSPRGRPAFWQAKEGTRCHPPTTHSRQEASPSCGAEQMRAGLWLFIRAHHRLPCACAGDCTTATGRPVRPCSAAQAQVAVKQAANHCRQLFYFSSLSYLQQGHTKGHHIHFACHCHLHVGTANKRSCNVPLVAADQHVCSPFCAWLRVSSVPYLCSFFGSPT